MSKLASGASVGKQVVLTFDDGFADIAEVAYPCMEALEAKGCLYVVSEAVGRDQVLWPDRVALAIDRSPVGNFTFTACGQTVTYHIDDESSRSKAVSDAIHRLRSMPDGDRRAVLNQFPEPSNIPKSLKIVSEKQLAELNKDILEVGSHTQSHPECTKLTSQAEFETELGTSKVVLEEIVKYRIDHFCYPSGSFNQMLPHKLQQFGYVTATTTVPGFVDTNSELLTLKRLNGTVDFSVFKALVSGAALPLLNINFWIKNRMRQRGKKK
ncbi:MAG: polysaccharide deacetylase family protein [Dehalogenimonas sp.]